MKWWKSFSKKEKMILLFLIIVGLSRYMMAYVPPFSSYVRLWYLGPYAHVFVNESRLHQMKFEFISGEKMRVLEFAPGQWDQGVRYGYFVRQAAVNALTSSLFGGAHRSVGHLIRSYICGGVKVRSNMVTGFYPERVRVYTRPHRKADYLFRHEHVCINKAANE